MKLSVRGCCFECRLLVRRLAARSRSRPDVEHPGYVHDIAWATDGGFLATAFLERAGSDHQPISVLSRQAANGALDWELQGDANEFLGVLSATAGGGAVVAVSMLDWHEDGPNRPAGLDWYDREGKLTANWRPGARDTPDTLGEIDAVQALPDGGVYWAGQTQSDDLSATAVVAGLIDAERQLRWLVTIPMPGDDVAPGQPRDGALTENGGLVLLVSYLPASSDGSIVWSSFVVKLAPDGSETWRTIILAGQGHGIAAPSNVMVAGNFDTSMTVGHLQLRHDSPGHHHFVAELDPDGQPIALSFLECRPPSIATRPPRNEPHDP